MIVPTCKAKDNATTVQRTEAKEDESRFLLQFTNPLKRYAHSSKKTIIHCLPTGANRLVRKKTAASSILKSLLYPLRETFMGQNGTYTSKIFCFVFSYR